MVQFKIIIPVEWLSLSLSSNAHQNSPLSIPDFWHDFDWDDDESLAIIKERFNNHCERMVQNQPERDLFFITHNFSFLDSSKQKIILRRHIAFESPDNLHSAEIHVSLTHSTISKAEIVFYFHSNAINDSFDVFKDNLLLQSQHPNVITQEQNIMCYRQQECVKARNFINWLNQQTINRHFLDSLLRQKKDPSKMELSFCLLYQLDAKTKRFFNHHHISFNLEDFLIIDESLDVYITFNVVKQTYDASIIATIFSENIAQYQYQNSDVYIYRYAFQHCQNSLWTPHSIHFQYKNHPVEWTVQDTPSFQHQQQNMNFHNLCHDLYFNFESPTDSIEPTIQSMETCNYIQTLGLAQQFKFDANGLLKETIYSAQFNNVHDFKHLTERDAIFICLITNDEEYYQRIQALEPNLNFQSDIDIIKINLLTEQFQKEIEIGLVFKQAIEQTLELAPFTNNQFYTTLRALLDKNGVHENCGTSSHFVFDELIPF